jgi:hypothetical protein
MPLTSNPTLIYKRILNVTTGRGQRQIQLLSSGTFLNMVYRYRIIPIQYHTLLGVSVLYPTQTERYKII